MNLIMQTHADLIARRRLLERLVAVEMELIDDPFRGFAAARVIAQARHELALIDAQERPRQGTR